MTEDQAPPMSRPRVAAGALFFDDAGRVLLVKPTYKEGWDIPGGYVEPGETPIEACVREVKEELGLDRQIGRLLVVDWAPSTGEGDKILFVFDGGEIDQDERSRITLPRDELMDLDFLSADSLDQHLGDRLLTRISEALRARSVDTTLYLQHGSEPV